MSEGARFGRAVASGEEHDEVPKLGTRVPDCGIHLPSRTGFRRETRTPRPLIGTCTAALRGRLQPPHA
eukprot:1398716-Prymnesium_polylepis.1